MLMSDHEFSVVKALVDKEGSQSVKNHFYLYVEARKYHKWFQEYKDRPMITNLRPSEVPTMMMLIQISEINKVNQKLELLLKK